MKTVWEYRVETTGGVLRGTSPQKIESLLNEAAQAGWELVSLTPLQNTNRLLAVLRRQSPSRSAGRSRDWP